MDPEVMKYFRKIITSFSMGLLWLFMAATFGLYFGLALVDHHVYWYNWTFYLLFLLSLIFLLRFYYRLWSIDQEL